MTLAVILDILVIALIGAAALYGGLLSMRLRKLGAAQAELVASIETFNDAARQADEALKRIETAGVTKGAELLAATTRAQKLATEISVMTSAGERIADRLEAAIGDVRAIGASAARKGRRAA